jgi:hypothetical protein
MRPEDIRVLASRLSEALWPGFRLTNWVGPTMTPSLFWNPSRA